MISVIVDPTIRYPAADECFSPDERYPEYRHAHLSVQKNPVYKAVRDCFVQAGLDREHLGTAAWNPLGRYIEPGNRVFLLCNFASERRAGEPLADYRSRCSHGSVIRALADYILIAVGGQGNVTIGNAPVQFTHWEAVLKDTEMQPVFDFYRSTGAPVQPRDLRLYVTEGNWWGVIKSVERRDEQAGIHVYLNQDSLFDELDCQHPNRYRAMNYDPRRTQSFHSHGHHEYVINRHILESDVIFHAPKLKTHEKVAISCVLKGMVGTVGHKDSLPHHRYGSPQLGGDEYPTEGDRPMRWATAWHERSEQTRPDSALGSVMRVTYKVFRRLIRPWSPVVDGAWWGNDTAWRMVVDLARISTYADATGQMQSFPCRTHIALTDGIIAGEGEGPESSTPVHSGVLALSDNLVAADYVNALMMGYDPERIPMIGRAACLAKYPLVSSDPRNEPVRLNGRDYRVSDLPGLEPIRLKPPDGWKQVL
jgi:uncharacterized protein (DUF362 family)